MEMCYGNGIDDFVVPQYGDLPVNNWFRWGMSVPQGFGSANKHFVMGSDLNHNELNFNGKRSRYDVEMGASLHSKNRYSDSTPVYEAFSNLSQLDDFLGIDQMDDVFLNSLLDDLPATENFHKSVCISPGEDDIYAPSWENREATLCKSEHNDHHSVQIELLPIYEENRTCEYIGEEASVEEYVLQDLEIVMTQLTEKTRICFRDALYRLAKNSMQHMLPNNESTRPERKEAMESMTNTIDRTIANLMFSEMESNVRNIPSGLRSYDSNQNDGIEKTLPGDAEVPVHYV